MHVDKNVDGIKFEPVGGDVICVTLGIKGAGDVAGYRAKRGVVLISERCLVI